MILTVAPLTRHGRVGRGREQVATRLRRVVWAVACVCALGVAAPSVLAQSKPGEDPATARFPGFEAQVGNLEGMVDRLSREYENPQIVTKAYPLERRLIDARIAYELGSYEAASVMLTELVEVPAFQTNPDYARARLWLAESLEAIGNVRAAEVQLRKVVGMVSASDPALADQARFRLVELAVARGQDALLREVLRDIGNTPTDATRYAVGKGWLRLEDYPKARRAFGGVAAASELYLKARYYTAVVASAEALGPDGSYDGAKLDEAMAIFTELSRLAPRDEAETKLRDLSLLGVGRIALEQGRVDEAIVAYQRVDRNSASYEVALYEMAWAHIKRENYAKALRVVDVLLLTVEDPRLDVEGHVLRGRLNIFMQAYEEATESYEVILDRFAPIRNELDRFVADPQNIRDYFTWLIERTTTDADLTAPLTERTAAWVASTDAMERVIGVFDDVAGQRASVDEVRELAEELDRLITSKNRVELFPLFQEGWTRALAAENQLLKLSSEMLDAQYERAKRHADGTRRAALDEMVVWRRKLELRLNGMPMTYGEYQLRKSKVDERFLDLRRKSFLVGQNLKEVRRQLLALETYVDEMQFADGPKDDRMSDAREQELRAEIGGEKGRLQALLAELETLDKQIAIEAARVGTGDMVTQGEAGLKGQIIQAHKREALMYQDLGDGPMVPRAGSTAAYEVARERIWLTVGRVARIVQAIDAKVAEKTQTLRAQVAGEAGKIEGYGVDVAAYARDSEELVVVRGEELFATARDRMNDAVLEADLGLLDVAWQQKRESTSDVSELNRAKSEKLRRLQEDLQALTDGMDESASEGGGE